MRWIFYPVCYLISLLFLGEVQIPGQGTRLQGTAFDVDLYCNLFLLNAAENSLKLYSREGTLLREVGGSGWSDGQFDRPAGVWAQNGIDVFVADYGNHRIQRFDRELNFVASLSTRDNDNPDERFGYPTDIALSRLGDLFICDGENLRIVKVNSFVKVERTFGGFGAGKGRLQNPTELAIGSNDDIYVLDGARIVVFDNFGNFVTELCEGLFKHPSCLYADAHGVVVVDDDRLYCFDQADRPIFAAPMDSLMGGQHEAVHAVGAGKGTLYVLTKSGLQTMPDPRATVAHDDLDKEEKSR